MDLNQVVLAHNPYSAVGIIKVEGTVIHDGIRLLIEGVLAQVNGNPITDDERNRVAAEMVRRWNAIQGISDLISHINKGDLTRMELAVLRIATGYQPTLEEVEASINNSVILAES